MCMRNYVKSYGKHRPICGGALLVPSMGYENLAPITAIMILAPLVLWYIYVCDDVIPLLTIAMPVLIGVACASSLIFMVLCMITEPGILPTVSYEDRNATENRQRYRTFIYLQRKHYELIQFRAKFSKYTDNCIENFDHYCPWVGNAIAKRNYHFFIYFLTSILILASLILFSSATVIFHAVFHDHKKFLDTVKSHIPAVIIILYTFGMFLSLLGLCGFHTMAISQNITTNEYLKRVYTVNNPNPYDKGCLRNYCNFFRCRVPKSRVSVVNQTSPLLSEVENGLLEEQMVDTQVSNDTDATEVLEL